MRPALPAFVEWKKPGRKEFTLYDSLHVKSAKTGKTGTVLEVKGMVINNLEELLEDLRRLEMFCVLSWTQRHTQGF